MHWLVSALGVEEKDKKKTAKPAEGTNKFHRLLGGVRCYCCRQGRPFQSACILYLLMVRIYSQSSSLYDKSLPLAMVRAGPHGPAGVTVDK